MFLRNLGIEIKPAKKRGRHEEQGTALDELVLSLPSGSTYSKCFTTRVKFEFLPPAKPNAPRSITCEEMPETRACRSAPFFGRFEHLDETPLPMCAPQKRLREPATYESRCQENTMSGHERSLKKRRREHLHVFTE